MTLTVYAIRSEAGPVKIGISKSPRDRLNTLLLQQPFGAELVHTLNADDETARAIESAAHGLLTAKRKRGEWFNVSTAEAIAAIAEAAALVESGATISKPASRSDLERIQMVAPKIWFSHIDEWRATQRPIPNKSEAIRLLIDKALAADKQV